MENTTILMTIALGLSAVLIFGGGILLSKAIRSDKIQKKDEKKDNNSSLLITAAIMVSAGLIFGGGVLISHAVRTDNIQDSEPEILEETTTNNQEDIIVDASASVTDIATTTTITTAIVTEYTAIETTTEATTEPETEPETEPVLLPLSEVQVSGKGNEGGFYTDYYSDNSIIISGVITSGNYGLTTYDDVYGDHTSVIIPESVNGYTVRDIGVSSLSMGYPDLDWSGVKEVSVPTGMRFTIDYETEISFEEAEPYFSRYGISLTTY